MEKIDLKALKVNFENLENKEWCDFKDVDIQVNEIKLDIYIPKDLTWFAGHFPDQAVLPGVVQTHWACELAQYFFSVSGFEKAVNLKFINMILPDKNLTLIMNFKEEKKSVMFIFKSETETFSSGSLRFKQG